MLRKATSAGTAAALFGAERTLPLLAACWPGAVGRRLAERTRVVSLEGATLIVRVPDARYSRILHRLRREILERLRASAGARAPRALGFVEAGAAPEPAAPPPRAEAEPKAAAPRATLANAARAIEDEEIRALFLASASRYLAQRSRE